MNYSDMKNVDGLLRANLDSVQRQERTLIDDTVTTALSDIASWASELMNGDTIVPGIPTGGPDTHYAAEILTVRDLLRETIDTANQRQREIFNLMD